MIKNYDELPQGNHAEHPETYSGLCHCVGYGGESPVNFDRHFFQSMKKRSKKISKKISRPKETHRMKPNLNCQVLHCPDFCEGFRRRKENKD